MALLLLAACSHVDGLVSEDAGILNAVARDPFLQEMIGKDGTAYLDPRTRLDSLHPLAREDAPVTLFQGVSGEDVSVTAHLARDLRARNRRSAGIGSIASGLPYFTPNPGETTRRVEISAPAISAEGDAAVVAVKIFTVNGSCPSGYSVVLRRTALGWHVHGHGAFWIV